MSLTENSFVEVRTSTDSFTWYEGQIIDVDVKSQMVKVSFSVWEPRTVQAHLVRKAVPTVLTDFEPRVGELVEVKMAESADCPAGWTRGRVKSIKGDFFFMTFDSTSTSGLRDMIVEKDSLRPVCTQPTLDLSRVDRCAVPIDSQLHAWLQSDDAASVFGNIKDRSGLVHVGPCGEVVTMIGDAVAVRRGRMLLEVHVKHQKELLSFQDRRDKKLKALDEQRQRYASQVHVEFSVSADVIGLVIGKGGENIKRVSAQHKVEARVVESANQNRTVTIKVSGDSHETVNAARMDLEITSQNYKVDEKLVGWLLGKQMRNIQEIQQKSGLLHARFQRDSKILELCGTRLQIEDAIVLLDSHMQYYDVYKEYDREDDALFKDLNSFRQRRPPQVGKNLKKKNEENSVRN